MAQASYEKKVRVSTDAVTWYDVPCSSPALNNGAEVLDSTELATNAGFRSRLLGLIDWSISCDSYLEVGNSALNTIRNAMFNRSVLHVQYLPDGDVANGYQGQVVVESYNLSGDIASLETIGITLQANGALVAAS